MKVPTGGGKTLLAAHSVSRVMSKLLRANHGLVLWIVPNESIYSQTRKALNNREHPYRQTLDRVAAGRVKILDKTSPLSKEDELRERTSRYIRPICLLQVERTGKEQREMGFTHAEDAREHLLMLGVGEHQIAIKTSEKNDLKEPENQDLLSPENEVRFIITKQALQEGWDCPFAYVLCSLAPNSSRNAMTQLIGRILRQPDTRKTGITALDECYVFCFHVATRDIVEGIKKGLEWAIW